jgi:hypothetical protein
MLLFYAVLVDIEKTVAAEVDVKRRWLGEQGVVRGPYWPYIGNPRLPMMPSDFGKLIVDETEKWAKVIKFAGIKPDWRPSRVP